MLLQPMPWSTQNQRLNVWHEKRLKPLENETDVFVLSINPIFWIRPASGEKQFQNLSSEYPDVELSHMLVDNCAMQQVRNPKQFDVILTGNMFGDILSDEASMLTGSIGMLPSASIGDSTGLYEPVHGSAPDIAGQGKANPLAAIASAAMLCRYSLDLPKAAENIEASINEVLAAGYRSGDIYSDSENETLLSTELMGEQILKSLLKPESVN